MTEAKKERNMTEKGFLHKSNGKIAADAFLAQHRAWLETGELAMVTTPILRKLDDKEVLPTPALDEIRTVVFNHMIAKAAAKAEDSILNPKTGGRSAAPKNWVSKILNEKGEIQTRVTEKGETEELEKGFDLSSDADRWSDRRLVECSSDCYAVVSHSMMPIETIIRRDDAMSRIFKIAKGPSMKAQPKGGSGRLSFGVKVKEDRARFSSG
jgi:hypothetical protein